MLFFQIFFPLFTFGWAIKISFFDRFSEDNLDELLYKGFIQKEKLWTSTTYYQLLGIGVIIPLFMNKTTKKIIDKITAL